MSLGQLSVKQSKLAKQRLERAGFKIMMLGDSMLISPPHGHMLTEESRRIIKEILDNIVKRKERIVFT